MTVIETEIARLKSRVSYLEDAMRRLGRHPLPEDRADQMASWEMDDLDAWPDELGLERAPTDEEIACAAEWDDLPEGEREAHVRRMDALTLDPPLSQVIADGRR